MARNTAFSPSYGNNQEVNPTNTSQTISLIKSAQSVRIYNESATAKVFINIGSGSITATASDAIIAPGHTVVFTKSCDADTLAYLDPANTGDNLYVQCGEGMQ